MIQEHDNSIRVFYGSHYLEGEVIARTPSTLVVKCADHYSEHGRQFKLIYDSNNLIHLTHLNQIPIVRYRNINGYIHEEQFHEVRFLRQKHFDEIHATYHGKRGAFSMFTWVCDIALDNPFFLENGGFNIGRVKSTIAHEFSHRAMALIDDDLYYEFLADFSRKRSDWVRIVAGYLFFWGTEEDYLTSRPLYRNQNSWLSLVPDAKHRLEAEEPAQLSRWVRKMLDELIAKRVSYFYRSTSAQSFVEFLDQAVIQHSEPIKSFLEQIRELTDQVNEFVLLDPIKVEQEF